ncbi:pseudoazurin [Diaphorobacter caeni]|uniref:pseudoazurin n=1 Tax=Diaphorobacter caeni TaxID=2784387 RepID=UPI0018907E96|nr:pseudoazurin [Diaphorobacter caeni]MBF5007347.1 pseudoazurin [Diaphorobacter caeni]
MPTRTITRLAATLLSMGLATAAFAETFEVKMLNRGPHGAMSYEPELLKIAPGDTVKYLASSTGHNAATVEGMLPANAAAFVGKINEEIEITLNEKGVYGIKCSPHYAMGMVMLIQVGDAPLSAMSIPGEAPDQARQRFQAIASRAASAH